MICILDLCGNHSPKRCFWIPKLNLPKSFIPNLIYTYFPNTQIWTTQIDKSLLKFKTWVFIGKNLQHWSSFALAYLYIEISEFLILDRPGKGGKKTLAQRTIVLSNIETRKLTNNMGKISREWLDASPVQPAKTTITWFNELFRTMASPQEARFFVPYFPRKALRQFQLRLSNFEIFYEK